MKKSNVAKIETMMSDFLQYRYKIFCVMGRRNADWEYYSGACKMIESCGGNWQRHYMGDDSEEEINNPNNYSHYVSLPSDERCENLNVDCWKD